MSDRSDVPRYILWVLIGIVLLALAGWADYAYRKKVVRDALREDRQQQGGR